MRFRNLKVVEKRGLGKSKKFLHLAETKREEFIFDLGRRVGR